MICPTCGQPQPSEFKMMAPLMPFDYDALSPEAKKAYDAMMARVKAFKRAAGA